MNISTEDAIQLLNKWKKDDSLLRVMCIFSGMILSSVCRIIEFSSTELHIGWDVGGLKVSLVGATFDYSDPREAPSPVRAALEEKFESALELYLPSGERCTLFELRSI
jgi:hypothetical protein